MRFNTSFAWVMRDVRSALRQLGRERGFAALAVLTLAAGIAANATMFGVVDRLLLRPPEHIRDPGQVRRVLLSQWARGEEELISPVTYHRFAELRDAAAGTAEISATYPQEATIGRGANAERVTGALASANFFPLTGVRPVLGRFFTPDEDVPPDGSRVVVLGHGLWQRRFGSDSTVLGSTLQIAGKDYSIIGVAPPGFTGIGHDRIDFWIPATTARTMFGWLTAEWATQPGFSWLSLVARVRAGASTEKAEAVLSAAYRDSKDRQAATVRFDDWPAGAPPPRAVLAPLLDARGPNPGETARVSLWLFGVAAIVLLIACINVANLLLVRGLQRRREIAIRLALGAGRGRLVSQLLVETTVLAVLGGALGLVLAHWAGAAIRGLLMPAADWTGALRDTRILLFSIAATLVTALLAGLAPAIQSTRADLTEALKSGAREGGGRRSRLRAGLLVAQSALAVVLLIGAGLFVSSLRNLRSADLGLDAERLIVAEIQANEAPLTPDALEARNATVLEAILSIPGVEGASTSLTLPFTSEISNWLATTSTDSAHKLGNFLMNAVGPEYFETMGVRMVRGRPLQSGDRAGSPRVVVVSEAAAHVLWPGQEAMGQCLKVGGPNAACSEVVGIARNVVSFNLTKVDETLQYWVPAAQGERGGGAIHGNGFVARVRGDPERLVTTVRSGIQQLLPGDATVRVRTFDALIAPQLRPWRLGAMMFTIFGLVSLLIAAVGLYGIIAYQVGQRRHEIGVRMALGARPGHLTRMVVGEGVGLTALGLAIGAAVALASSHWVEPLLFEVSPVDPLVYAGVVAVLIGVAVLASLVPAWRASRVNPSDALRAE